MSSRANRPPQVQDPAVRAILQTVRRALLMIAKEIERHTGGEPTPTE